MPTTDRQLTKFLSFALGINNVDPEHELEGEELRSAVNIDLNPAGKPRTRKGRVKVHTATDSIHSLWSDRKQTLFVDGEDLYHLSSSYELSLVRSGLAKGLPVSYENVGGDIYYSNGLISGKVTGAGEADYWGMECPISQPTLSLLGSGGMDAGEYQVAVTFVSGTGEESGTLLAAKIRLLAAGGIRLDNIPQPTRPDINRIRVYVTAADGVNLFLRAQVPVGVTTLSLNSIVQEGKRLETQFLIITPPGHIVRYYRGSMFIANENRLYFTPPWRYGLFDPIKGRFTFKSRIKIMEPTKEGIFVGADKLYFLAGRAVDAMQQRDVETLDCVEGTGVRVPSSMFGEQAGGVEYYPCWFAHPQGWVVGMNDGTIQMLMKDRVATPGYESGAGLFREQEGIRQLVGAMRGGGPADKFAAKDEITGTIIRNGIVIE